MSFNDGSSEVVGLGNLGLRGRGRRLERRHLGEEREDDGERSKEQEPADDERDDARGVVDGLGAGGEPVRGGAADGVVHLVEVAVVIREEGRAEVPVEFVLRVFKRVVLEQQPALLVVGLGRVVPDVVFGLQREGFRGVFVEEEFDGGELGLVGILPADGLVEADVFRGRGDDVLGVDGADLREELIELDLGGDDVPGGGVENDGGVGAPIVGVGGVAGERGGEVVGLGHCGRDVVVVLDAVARTVRPDDDVLVDGELNEPTLPEARAREVADARERRLGGEEQLGFAEHDLRQRIVDVQREAELRDAHGRLVQEVAEVVLAEDDVVWASESERGDLRVLEEQLHVLLPHDVRHEEVHVVQLLVRDVRLRRRVAPDYVR